jgi:protein-S-isoprenylcysteine O-methyltransferase Ste14
MVWNFILRPIEEENLARRFGKPYIDYFQSVYAYLPQARPYASLIISSSNGEAE